MNTYYHINAVDKPNRDSRHEHITYLGNNDENWKMMREAVIAHIKMGDTFYTIDYSTGKHVPIEIVYEAGKAPYVRTKPDGKWSDNLLAMPPCSAWARLIA